MTKKELVNEILGVKKVDTFANLMKKSLSELESIHVQVKQEQAPQPTTQVDMEALMAKMKEEMLADLKEQARQEVVSELEEKKEQVSAKPVSGRNDIDRFALIPVMNVTNGQLIYVSRKTGAEYLFGEYGDIEYMEYQELLTMRSSQRRFFDDPFLLVMDDDAVEALGLTKMYDNIKLPAQIEEVFKLGQSDFEEVLEKSPKGIKHLIITKAKELYDRGEFDSVRKIKFINETFKTDIGQRG